MTRVPTALWRLLSRSCGENSPLFLEVFAISFSTSDPGQTDDSPKVLQSTGFYATEETRLD